MRWVWLVIPLVLFGIIGIQESFTEEIPSPRQQLKEGVLPEDVICKQDRVLVIRNNWDALCVKETTAEKLNLQIIKIFDSSTVIDNLPVFEKSDEMIDENSNNEIDKNHLSLQQIYTVTQIFNEFEINWKQEYENADFSKTITNDKPFEESQLAGVILVYYSSLEYPEFIQVGEEFDVTVKWTFTEYDDEGNVEHQNIPINSLTKEIFDETLLRIKIPENIEMITDVSDWEESVKVYHDSSYNFDSSFTTYTKTTPFDYTDAMHEQTYRFKLVDPFLPPFDYMTFGGLGFGKKIHHQDGTLIPPQLDTASINALQSAITVEKLGSVDPQYPEVSPSEVNWGRAYEIATKGINTPTDPDENQTKDIRDFYVNILNRNPTNDELLNAGVSQGWIDSFFKKFPELK
jgi:hypothetical protein